MDSGIFQPATTASPGAQTAQEAQAAAGNGTATFRRLTDGPRGNPMLRRVAAPGPRDLVIDASLRAEMWRLCRLAEGDGDRATRADFRAARAIVVALDRAEAVTLAGLELDADMLTAWLGRFRDAARRLDLVARVG